MYISYIEIICHCAFVCTFSIVCSSNCTVAVSSPSSFSQLLRSPRCTRPASTWKMASISESSKPTVASAVQSCLKSFASRSYHSKSMETYGKATRKRHETAPRTAAPSSFRRDPALRRCSVARSGDLFAGSRPGDAPRAGLSASPRHRFLGVSPAFRLRFRRF